MLKNKYIKAFASLILAISVLIGTFPVMAASVGSVASDKTIGYDTVQDAVTTYEDVGTGTTNTDVYLTIDNGEIVVGIPTTIILSGTANDDGEYIGDYSVYAKGDISGDQSLLVYPNSDEITLSQTGKSDETAIISQDEIAFDCSELADGVSTTGSVTATSLTAGSWNGTADFVIDMQNNYVYYSSFALACADANDLTTENADVLRTNIGSAKAALKIADDTACISLLDDDDVSENISLTENTDINLKNNTLNFTEGSYLTYSDNLTVKNGTLSAVNSPYLILGDKTYTDNTLTLNHVDFIEEITSSIGSNVMLVDSSSNEKNVNNCSFEVSGDGNSSYICLALALRNDDSTNAVKNCTINTSVKNGTTYAIQPSGSNSIVSNTINLSNTDTKLIIGININSKEITTTLLEDNHITINTELGASYGVYDYSSTEANKIIKNNVIDLSSNSGRCYGLYLCRGSNEIDETSISVSSNAARSQGVYQLSSATGDIEINNSNITAFSNDNNSLGVYYSSSKNIKINNTEIKTSSVNLDTYDVYVAKTASGILEINNTKMSASNTNSGANGVLFEGNTTAAVFLNDIDIYTVSSYGDARGIQQQTTSANDIEINGCNIYSETTYDKLGIGVAAIGTGSFVINSTEDHPVNVFGKEWGIETSPYQKTVINGGTYTSTDHPMYVSGSADVFDATFYVTNRDKYTVLDVAYGGVYCGSPYCPEDAVVNFYNCTFGNENTKSPLDSKCLVSQMNYGCTAPAEINVTDCTFYSPSNSAFFAYHGGASADNGLNKTKFNIYGDTVFYKPYDTSVGHWEAYTKDEVTDLISTWKETVLSTNSAGNAFVQAPSRAKCENGKVVEIYIEDDANVYDYR